MIRPSALTLGLLMGIVDPRIDKTVRSPVMTFEELEAEYDLIQQKKSSLSASKRMDIVIKYERTVVARSKRDV